MYEPRCLRQAAHRKHSRWNIFVFARITKSFLVKTVWQAEHRAPYSLQEKGTEQYSTEQYGTEQYGTEQYSTEQGSREHHRIEQYSSAL